MNKQITILALLTLVFAANCYCQIDYELRGPNRDGYYSDENNLLKEWSTEGPELLHTISNIGEGFTLPAVTNDRIYITGMIDTTGVLFAYDLKGNLIWEKAYGPEWTANYPGSRSTPTVANNKIYFEDSFGNVYCFDKEGNIVWTINMEKEFGFRSLQYGANESLLIDGNKLYCTPGGENIMMAVLDKDTGKTLHTIKGNGQQSAHCAPVIVNHNNKRILLTMTSNALVGVDVDKNEMIFQSEFSNSWKGNPNTPLYHNGQILIFTEGTGSQLLELSTDGHSIDTLWTNNLYDSENEGAILHNGLVYMGAAKQKTWYCFDWKTGKTIYIDKSIGKANVVFADGLLYTYNFRGYISLLNPNAEKHEEISKFKMEQGTKQHITHPVIKNGRLYIRHGNAVNIYNISKS